LRFVAVANQVNYYRNHGNGRHGRCRQDGAKQQVSLRRVIRQCSAASVSPETEIDKRKPCLDWLWSSLVEKTRLQPSRASDDRCRKCCWHVSQF
jgi:hypothetical protein